MWWLLAVVVLVVAAVGTFLSKSLPGPGRKTVLSRLRR